PGAGPRAIAAAQNAINNWENRHILAREALLKSLDYAELGRVEDIQDSAPAIWNRLREEYSHVLNIEYLRADAEFHALKKDNKTTINAHIDKFVTLLNARDYHRPPGTPRMQPATVNLQLMTSLINPDDKIDDWKLFRTAKGNAIRTMSTAELFAEVRATDSGQQSSKTANQTPVQPPPDAAKALITQFNSGKTQRGGHRGGYRGSYRGGRGKFNGGFEGRNSDGFRGRGRGKGKEKS